LFATSFFCRKYIGRVQACGALSLHQELIQTVAKDPVSELVDAYR
jgi:hypothetical protein